jgi:uncharacterized protein YbjT (DUF2867 family)
MSKVLVTGGTGKLGREVVSRLLADHHTTRILSHKKAASVPQEVEVYYGDLASGTGLGEAVAGVDAIIHCASSPAYDTRMTDVEGTRRLLQAAKVRGSPHIVYISIVGIDQSAYAYYQAKRDAETIIEQAHLPWTILRTTQFHDFVLHLIHEFKADTLTEVPVVEGMRFQSIDISEVADRLVTLMEQGPAGRVPDMGGPQILTIEEMTETYLRIRGRTATVRSEPPPGAQFSVFRSGINLTPDHAEGTITWETFLHRLYDG